MAGLVSAQSKTGKKEKKLETVKVVTKADSTQGPDPIEDNPNLNQRRIYEFSNGQKSTPAGKEATAVNGGYASLKDQPTTNAKPVSKKKAVRKAEAKKEKAKAKRSGN